MKPSPFDYVRATSVAHAVEQLSTGGDVRVLAGGQSLMPLLNLRLSAPEVVVDIGRVGELRTLDIVRGGRDGSRDVLRIGAAVTQTEVAAHPGVTERWPMLAAAIAEIGHPQIRHRGTVCGSLAHNDPRAELPAVAMALDAGVIAQSSSGERSVAADELFRGPFTTSLEAGELMTAVELPEPAPDQGWSFREFSHQPGDFAMAGVAAVMWRDGRRVESRLVAFGLGGGPRRATPIEHALLDAAGPDLDPAAIEAWTATLDPADDPHASAHSKVRHARRLMLEAVAEAWSRMR